MYGNYVSFSDSEVVNTSMVAIFSKYTLSLTVVELDFYTTAKCMFCPIGFFPPPAIHCNIWLPIFPSSFNFQCNEKFILFL